MEKNTRPKRLRGPDAGCRKCGCELLLGENWSHSMKKYSRYWCNPCYTQRQKEYSSRDPDANKKKSESARIRRSKWTDERREIERLKARNASLKKTYGITLVEYKRIFEAQGGKCSICFLDLVEKIGRGNNQVHLDHCHSTGVIRGILCGHCNRMLGMAMDMAWVLKRAADYISRIRDDVIIAHPSPNFRPGRPTEYYTADHKLENRASGGKRY